MCSTQHCLSQALCTFWTPKTIPKPCNTAPFTSQRPSAKLDQHYPASFYLCTAPEQPALMLVVRPCAQRNHVCRVHSAHFGHPRPYLSPATPLHSPPRLAALHFPSPAPVSLPSIFPPQSRPHPRASFPPTCLPSRSTPSSLPSPSPTHVPPVSLPSIFPPQPQPRPCACALAPLHLSPMIMEDY